MYDSIIKRLEENVGHVIYGKSDVVRLVTVALIGRGHILLEDIPGVGKTSLAQALARSIGIKFHRIQFTSDMLPADIIGVNVFSRSSETFDFRPGPIFAGILLADEINRTTPKTQSALLEAMNEAQVTVDNVTYVLPQPFMVIATQNPLEFHGTFPLPESQLDRFMMSATMGYPAPEYEMAILREMRYAMSVDGLKPVVTSDEVIALQQKADSVKIDEDLLNYVLEIINATRASDRVALGASPRGGLALKQAAKAAAICDGRDYVIPDDIKSLTIPVLAHRIIPTGGAADPTGRIHRARQLLRDLLDEVPVPI